MKKLLFSLYALLTAITTTAQSEDPQCGTDQIIIRNPFLQKLYSERASCAPEVDLDTAQVLTIPVVVHVLHLGEEVGEGTNISDEQVFSCIENLNHRFRADTIALADLTDEYDAHELSFAIDSKIEFCLATRDPEGNPTTGIDRQDCSLLEYTSTFSGQTSTAYYAEKGISNLSQWTLPLQGIPDNVLKDQFHWPHVDYFNMYVVSEINNNNGGNGVQGYSYVGSLGSATSGDAYGPVCLYNVTGTTGELKWNRKLNATWTHECGHALGLFHTFSNGFQTTDSCDPETNPCTQGDQCPDTPPSPPNQSCNPIFADCPDAMLENYMDYTGEDCKTAFTQNQIEKMRDEVYNGLPYLISADNISCESPCDLGECPTDLNGDGVTASGDLLTFLSYYSVFPEPCDPRDFNQDGVINSADLLIVLANYGSLCFEASAQLITNVNENGLGIPTEIEYYTISGQKIQPGDLAYGIYIVVERWEDGTVKTKKVFRFN